LLDLAIIIIYFLGLIAVGIYAYRNKKSSTPNGFFVANRSGSSLLIIGSLCATIIGASVTLGMAGLGYFRGLTGAWWLLVGSAGLLILGFFFARTVRRFGLYTLPELVEKQYGKTTGVVASVLIVISWMAIVAAQIIAAGKILSVMLPSIELAPLMIIAAAVFTIYTVLGGQYSVIRTDFVQFGIIVVGVIVCLGLVLSHVGGSSGLQNSLPSDYFSFPVSTKFGWLDLLSLLILVGSTYVVGPDMYSRLFCARNEKVAKTSALSAALITIPIAFIIVLIGIGAKVLYPDIGQEQALPMIVRYILPAGATGLVIAAILAAVMSSADTCLITTSTIFTADIYKRIFPKMGERRTVAVSRIAVLVIGGLSLAIALQLQGIINSLMLAYTVFTSGVVLPVVAGFFKNKLKVNSIGAVAAIIGGGGTALWIKQWQVTSLAGVHIGHIELIGFGVCAVLLFGVSWITRMMGYHRPGRSLEVAD
jgi:SSS family solute:Na+ symporter